jgi:hypothetical protein
MFIENAQIETGTRFYAAWLFQNAHDDGYQISFAQGFTPNGVLMNPTPVNVSKGQLVKIKQCVEIGLPFEVKPASNHRVRVFVY